MFLKVATINQLIIMPLELRKDSGWWYGRASVNGKALCKNLSVKIAGNRPKKLSLQGDMTFERSRAKAQAELEKWQLELKRRTTAEELIQTVHEIRTGERIQSIALADAFARWLALPRRRQPSSRYVDQAKSWMTRFVAYLKSNYPSAREMDDVHSNMARTFFSDEQKRGIAPKTYNNILIFLRSSFGALQKDAGMAENPFAGLPTLEEDTVFRKPFSAEELADIADAAKTDPFIHPIIITGMCTAMRRGDCCLLQWESVDLEARFIMVKTSKTGELVQIPIFAQLHEVLTQAQKDRQEKNEKSPYVFPEQADKYQNNPDLITDRVRRVLREVGFSGEDGDGTSEKGCVNQKRKVGLRKASVRDFHSFRVSWVTLALTAGVPLEIVQKVTGHRTASIVMTHYFQPGREEFRKTLSGKLPEAISGQSEKPAPVVISLDEIRAELLAMKLKTWKTIRDGLVAKIPEPTPAAKPPAGKKPMLTVKAVEKDAAG
ncbi:site-specific integrase [Termitidicoccus mucosus]